ncbi:tripartite motif-containing protein 43-like [Bubalus bubalis]|uniref:tripartite motif-containing protein 43-like n=1 Tax=Bubalus bubalis TaxID=89462 RepID=UPI001E1B7BE6|nr:tripartite motif-containing protein 43-like [Bubalus bubalis]
MSSKSFQNEVTCSLCVKYFIDPVTLGSGHSFCMPCLCLYWEEGERPPHCPVCKETSHQLNLKTNTDLRKLVFLARQKGLYDLPNRAGEICEIHRYTKKFFCKVTKDVRCLLCCMSEQQGTPRHGSLQWTAEEYRQKLLNIMRSMWKKIQENKRNLNRETNKIRTWDISKKFYFIQHRIGTHDVYSKPTFELNILMFMFQYG